MSPKFLVVKTVGQNPMARLGDENVGALSGSHARHPDDLVSTVLSESLNRGSGSTGDLVRPSLIHQSPAT